MRRPAECHVAFAKVWFCIVPIQMFGCKRPFYVKLLDSHPRNQFNSCPVFEFVATHRVYSLKASLDRMEDSRQEGRNSLNSLVFSVDQFQLCSGYALGKLPVNLPESRIATTIQDPVARECFD